MSDADKVTPELESKRDYFNRMGWCECITCADVFYEWEHYEQHDCPYQGVIPDLYNFNWEVTE